jgi:hypothetical protein
VLAALVNRSAAFNEAAEKALRAVRTALDQVNDLAAARRLLAKFVDLSPHSARLFEVTLHSLFQVLEDHCALDGSLSPLSQMRTANKKHGNVGDIEVASRPGSLHIIEAWDAKYGKPYLREELDELEDKLRDHPETKIVGFVVDGKPNLKTEVSDRLDEVERDNGVKVVITSFADWVSSQATRCSVKEATLAREWLIAFAESIAQKRRNRAPIDEPTDEWIRALEAFAKTWR